MATSLRRVTLALLSVMPSLAYAQSPGPSLPPDSAVLAVLRARVDVGHVAGIVVALIDAHAIARSGADTLSAGPQMRVVAYGRGAGGGPLDAHSLFEIGSITKTFTSVALARMVADGKVRLDQLVVELLPRGAVVPSRGGGRALSSFTERIKRFALTCCRTPVARIKHCTPRSSAHSLFVRSFDARN